MLSINLLTLAAFYAAHAQAANYDTYPSVAKTASINGFADPIYSGLPECAKSCVEEDTDSTPCPYWDTGCLCVMSNWGSPVADCIAENCKGNDVSVATSLAMSQCSSAGVGEPYWYIASSASAALSSAAEATVTEVSSSAEETSTQAESSAAVETSTPVQTSSAVESSSAAETSVPAESSAPATTSAPVTSSVQAISSVQATSSAPVDSSVASQSSESQSSSASSEVPEVEAQENAAALNIPGQILIGLSALSFGVLLF